MKSIKKRAVLVLTAAIILTSFPFTGRTAGAEILPDITTETAVSAETSEILDLVNGHDDTMTDTGEPEYAEGDVIVCMSTGEDDSSYSGGDITNDKAGEILSLLNDAEGLMEVTEAVKESDLYDPSTEQGMNWDDPVSNDKALSDEEYELKYVHSDKYSTQQMIDILEGTPGVLFAEPNYIYHLSDEDITVDEVPYKLKDEAAVIEDTEISYKNESTVITEILEENPSEAADINRDTAALASPDLTGKQYAYGNGPGGMDVPYWNTLGRENAGNTVVAVMDSGVDYMHEDLKNVMWDKGLTYSELTDLGGGQYGFNAMKKNSRNQLYNKYDPMDDHYHGSHCAGSVGAPWNGIGVSGTANGTKIMAVKASDDKGAFPLDVCLRGFNYILTAKKAGVNVVAVNNSWGGKALSYSTMLATSELYDAGVICCFSSGNDTWNTDYTYKTGSLLRENEGVICVDAGGDTGALCSFSNYGIRTTDLSAPGGYIMSTFPRGKGAPDPRLSAPMIDQNGREIRDLFDKEGTYFTYSTRNGASGNIGYDGDQKVLSLNGMTRGTGFLTISCNGLSERPKYFAISGRYELADEFAVIVFVLLNNGEYARVVPNDYENNIYTSINTYTLPENMNLERPEIILASEFRTGKNDKTYYINGISFTNERTDYSVISGTSMSTPAVTGEVAVLASKWPGDSAGRRAARVIGSTKALPSLRDTSRTGGVANVRKALDCDYVPVVNKVWVDEKGLLNISGYFFGNEKGTVSINSDGTDLANVKIETWEGQKKADWQDDTKNDTDTIKVGLNSGTIPTDEVMITVTSSDGRSGSRMLIILGLDDSARREHFYEKLPVPSSDNADIYKGFLGTWFCSCVGLDGHIYFTGDETNATKDNYYLWRYTLSGDKVKAPLERMDRSLYSSCYSNICAWNKMLVFMDEMDDHIKMYSPAEDNLYDTGIYIPNIRYSYSYMVNAGSDLYLLLTLSKYDATQEKDIDVNTDLYRIDIGKGKATWMYTLKSIQNSPVVWIDKDGSGKIYLHSLAKKDDTNIAAENILIEGDAISSESTVIPLPVNCHFDNEKLKGARTQYGIVLTGPADKTDNTDNFLFDPADNSIKKCTKQIYSGRPGNSAVAEYNGVTYFLCTGIYSKEGATIAYTGNDEFKKDGEEVKPPLHYYGDDKVMDVDGIAIEVDLKVGNDGDVPIGKTINVTPVVTEKRGNKISYTWYSEDAEIALVDQSGKVTGKAVGETTIHARGWDSAGNKYEGKCKVFVYPLTGSIKLSATKLTVTGGNEFTIRAELSPGEALKDEVKWSLSVPTSYPEAVIKTGEGWDDDGCYATFKTVDPGENIQVKVTASLIDGSNKKASCTVTVAKPEGDGKAPVKSAELSETGTIYLGAGMEHKVSLVRVVPEDCGEYTVEWKSSDPAVTLRVNEKDASYAVLKGEKKGTSKITAVITNKASGGKKTITVKGLTVKVAQSNVSGNEVKIFNKKKDITGTISGNRLAVGKSVTLKAEVYMNGQALKAGKSAIIWTSSDPERATVVNGKIKAYREGEVTFTASVVPTEALISGSPEPVSAECTFYVYNPVKKIRIDRYKVYEEDGKRFDELIKAGIGNVKIPSVSESTLYLNAKGITDPVTNSDSVREDKTFEFTSSKPSVISISEDPTGCVALTPKAAGKSTITVTATDGSKKKTKFTVTVYNNVTEIKLFATNPGNATVSGNNTYEVTVSGLAVNKTIKLKAGVEPATVANKTVSYVSTAPGAVTVNNSGLVKRVGAGNADIYVTAVDGGYTAVCHVVSE